VGKDQTSTRVMHVLYRFEQEPKIADVHEVERENAYEVFGHARIH
jgi:hypothetical protein